MPSQKLFEAADVIALIQTARARGETVDAVRIPASAIKGPQPMDLALFTKKLELLSAAAKNLGVQAFVGADNIEPQATTMAQLNAEDTARAKAPGFRSR